jgi:PST family polysaccharide transporter
LIFLKKIKTAVKNKVWRKLFENFLSLSVLQGISFITELITFPYLTQTLKAENYGLISFALSFILFLQVITEYGFNHSGTRAISKNRDNQEKMKRIYSTISIVKIIISSVCFMSIIIIVNVFERFRLDAIIFLLLFGLIIQSILSPIWFFRGLEKMKYITIINFFGKGSLIILIFLFINTESSYVLYAFFIFLNSLFIGIISQVFIIRKYKMSIQKSSLIDIRSQFSEGFFMFLVYFSTNIINNLNPFILGLLADYYSVGIFTAGYKIIQIFVLIISLITTTVFPHIVKLVTGSNNRMESNAYKFIKRILLIIIIIGLLSLGFLYFFADFIVNFLFGVEYYETINVIKILSFAPLLIGIGHTLTLQIMVPLEYDSQVAKIYGFSAIVDVVLCFIFIPIFGYLALCFILLIVRIIPIILSFIWIRKNRVKLNLSNIQK